MPSDTIPKYDIDVDLGDLSGPKGNVFVIIGTVSAALRKHGVSHGEVTEFLQGVCEGDYEFALETCRTWVNATWTGRVEE